MLLLVVNDYQSLHQVIRDHSFLCHEEKKHCFLPIHMCCVFQCKEYSLLIEQCLFYLFSSTDNRILCIIVIYLESYVWGKTPNGLAVLPLVVHPSPSFSRGSSPTSVNSSASVVPSPTAINGGKYDLVMFTTSDSKVHICVVIQYRK